MKQSTECFVTLQPRRGPVLEMNTTPVFVLSNEFRVVFKKNKTDTPIHRARDGGTWAVSLEYW